MYYKGTPFETLIKPIDDTVSYKGTILALHGWNLYYNDWCDSTSLCDKAKAMGYVVVLPNMGKSVYSRRYYLQTRKDWSIFPTRMWFQDSLLTHLQTQFNLIVSDNDNFMVNDNYKSFVRLEKFNDSSIDIIVICFTSTKDWEKYLEIKEELAMEIKNNVEKIGLNFAFPSQSIYIEKNTSH